MTAYRSHSPVDIINICNFVSVICVKITEQTMESIVTDERPEDIFYG